jgi:MinD superfamily P-loop ATPase
MALWINEDCISCGACEPECPNEAITQGESIYVIDPAKCTDGCITVDPNHTESREQLEAKYHSLHG